tara:strand:- start:588 stop:962 length:375 start_codon:yes stop_codon:yes gene_type:complete
MCPCGKQVDLAKCCGRFLSGSAKARSAEQLMRSRFTAYTLGGYGEYLMNTWHPTMTAELNADLLSQKSHQWFKLKILDKFQKGDEATVEFEAFYHNHLDEECVHHEISSFVRVLGHWLYVGEEK